MINIPARIELIENLLKTNTIETSTYAALECRSTIEAICYDRFKISNSHLALADLRKWQPRDIIRQILEEANAEASESLILSIGKPIEPSFVGPTHPKDIEYVEMGRQSELRYRSLAKLHNALSNLALHVQIPTPDNPVSIYGDKRSIEEKVAQTLAELRSAATGNLLMSGFGPNTTFECFCGSTIKRMAALLTDGQVVSCNRMECAESYTVSVKDNETWFARRARLIPCRGCGNDLDIPERMMLRLKPSEHMTAICGNCGKSALFKWQFSMANNN